MRVRRQATSELRGRRLGPVEPNGQGAQAAQRQERFERAGDRPVVVAVRHQEFRVRRVLAHYRPEQEVGVPADQLRRGVQDDVGSEVQRTLAEWRRERRVDHGDRAALPRAGRDRGDVGDDDERVGDRLHPDHVGALGGPEDGVGVIGRDDAEL